VLLPGAAAGKLPLEYRQFLERDKRRRVGDRGRQPRRIERIDGLTLVCAANPYFVKESLLEFIGYAAIAIALIV